MVDPPKAAQIVVGSFPIDRRSDADLVRLVAEGNDAALAIVFQRYAASVRRTLRGQLRDDSAIDDLTQEVFLGFHRTAGNVTEPDKLRAYLVGTAFRQAKQYLRQRSRRHRLLGFFGHAQDDIGHSSPAPHARDDLRCLHEVLSRLPERLRDSFILRYVEELSPQEIADARRVSLATAKRDIGRARERVLYYARKEPALSDYLRLPDEKGDEPGESHPTLSPEKAESRSDVSSPHSTSTRSSGDNS